LKELDFKEDEIVRAKVLILGKLINPGSECKIYEWFKEFSGISELLGIAVDDISLSGLYRISDKLLEHKEEIESRLVERERELFGLGEKILLYDLTNTYFEGIIKDSPKAKRGNSKEKRFDQPLITVGLLA